MILQLAIDDGVQNRGHRLNIFKPDLQDIGTCDGTHYGYGVMSVALYRGRIGSGA